MWLRQPVSFYKDSAVRHPFDVTHCIVIDQMDDIPEGEDDNNPIIVPRPGQILRRTARTKIRKPGLPGDGGGHRFNATRRGAKSAKPDIEINSDNGHDSDPSDGTERPISYTTESLILDMYGDPRDSTISANSSAEDDDLTSQQSHSTAPTSVPQSSSHGGGSSQRPISPPVSTSLSPPRGQTVRRVSPPPIQYPGEQQPPPFQLQQPPLQQPPPPQPPLQQSPGPQLYHPTPRGHLDVPKQGSTPPSRTPSPSASDFGQPTPSTSPDPFRRSPSAPPPSSEFGYPSQTQGGGSPASSIRSVKSDKSSKEKKGLLKGMWGGEKKKDRGAQERENREREAAKEKEKEGGFFGSLFGGGKKKHDESEPGRGLPTGAGPAAAAALLGASKTRNQQGPLSPGLGGSFARYPIHVERAVYRLSHIKLANPRRPLYEQVLISNLMFWYLGVINKAATPAATGSTPSDGSSDSSHANGVPTKEREQERLEKEKAELEQRERAEREERERQEREKEREAARERESQQKEQQTKKRGTLVKNMPPGSGPGQRRAEMPVRGPQYDVQHQIMQQEGGSAGYPPMGRPMMRSNTTPVGEIYQPRGADPYQDPRPPRQQPPYHQYQQPPQPQPQPYPPQPPQQPYQNQPPYSNQPVYNPQQQQSYTQGGYTPQLGGYPSYGNGLPPGAMAPPTQGPVQPDQWSGASNPRDPYTSVGGIVPGPPPNIVPGPPPPPPGQGFSNRPMSPPKGQAPQFNASSPSSPPGAPRLVVRSASANTSGSPPPPAAQDFRQQQAGPYPPGPPPNGNWGPRSPPPPQQQRRGHSPQPPPQGERHRRVSGGSDNPATGWQQQPQYARGGPISR